MTSDCYRVEILHFINPHLIWVEVHSDSSEEITFEQLGLFGVLPLEFNIDILDKRLKTKRSKNWIPAATALMITVLDGAKEVWFTTTHIDQRTTIFDDNIFKFGEIIIVSTDNTQKHLSKALVEGGFAIYDACLFYQELANGKLNIKLSPVQTEEVIKQFHRYYRKKNKEEHHVKSLKKQTTISQVASHIQSTLTVANLERHNMMQPNNDMLLQKIKDLQLCKGIDEESVGRACKTSTKKQVTSNLIKKKLNIVKQNDNLITPAVMFNLTKEFIACNAVKKEPNDILQDRQTINHTDTKLIKEDNDDKTNEKGETQGKANLKIDTVDKSPETKDYKKAETSQRHSPKLPASAKQVRPANPIFGPPEVINVSNTLKNTEFINTPPKVCKQTSTPVVTNKDTEGNKKVATKSKLLLKKSMMLKEQKVLDRSLSESETTNKDTNSNDTSSEAIDNDSDKQELEDLEMKLRKEYKPILISHNREEISTMYFDTDKNNVIPCKIMDPNLSVFVDKLVTPVLMVHNKISKRIPPRSELREIPFNQHIHAVLRNMRIVHPMTLQTISWTTVLRGHTLFMISSSGSGKTMGYLPAVCRLVSDSQVDSVGSVGPTAIIVCATSRSVTDVHSVAKMFLGLKEKVLACYAGMDEFHLTTALLNGCDLMICTPSVLVRLLQVTDFGVDLRRLTTFVLDDCERLAEVYGKEIKFFLLKINEMLKNRANKQLKVQYILASRIWCDFMEPLAKKAPDTVVCIGAFQECVLYSKAPTTVKFVTSESKPQAVLDFLQDIDITKKIVIVCRYDEDVIMLEKVLVKKQYVVYACNNTMTVHDLYNLNLAWADYQDAALGPILLCCDNNLVHMNITDACYLLHYSLPQLFSSFSKRFAVLNDHYNSIFNTDSLDVKIHILIDDTNVEQLPKILNFIKRCTSEVPEQLQEISNKVLADKNLVKAQKCVPICDNLLALGECPDFWNCQERHAIFKDFDEPKQWMPRNGVISFKILHYHTAVKYSARLISNIENGTLIKYPQTYSTLSMKMGLFFGKDSNKRPHGIPQVGDICAVSLKQNYYARCRVLKILSYNTNNTPNYVLIKLIDEEKYERSQDVHLYYLPEELKNIETHVVQVRLANVQPKDKDVTFSDLARNQLRKITDEDEELYLRGKVTHTIGNCVFVETLEACQSLTALNEIVVKHDFKKLLLKSHGIVSPDHVTKLLQLSSHGKPPASDIESDVETISESSATKVYVKPQWAQLEQDISSVFFASAVSPSKFYVRLANSDDSMNILFKLMQEYVCKNTVPAATRNVGDIVLAKFPDDGTFERARIDEVFDDQVKCFFVDQGDWRKVNSSDLIPITEELVTKMPFQAIECRLIGIKPLGEDWTEFSTNWFCDKCFEENNEFIKNLSVKYFQKEKAESSGGYKYAVALIDTTGNDDIIVNNLLIEANLATEFEEEMHYLNELQLEKVDEVDTDTATESSDWEKISNVNNKIGTIAPSSPKSFTEPVTSAALLLRQPIRSMPLVGDDDDSSDFEKWDINMTNEFLDSLKPLSSQTADDKKIPALKESQSNDKTIQSLDSDDLTTPENSELSERPKEINENDQKEMKDEKRKPKLVWRQTKTTITAKILLLCEEYDLQIQQNRLTFSSYANDTDYGFEIDLYGVVNVSKCHHSNKGQYIQINLTKLLSRNWLTFTKDAVGKRWITYDIDSIDISSDEEEVDDKSIKNHLINIHNSKANSDSEDDEFLDDANFTYR